MRHLLGIEGLGTGFFTKLNYWNISRRNRPPLNHDMLLKLKSEFHEDIEALEIALDRDFLDIS